MTPSVEEITKQIDRFFNDTSRPIEETSDGLVVIVDECEMKLEMICEEKDNS